MQSIDKTDFKTEIFGYADDVAQTKTSRTELEITMKKWDQELTKAGLKLSYSKTEYMKVGKQPEDNTTIVNGHELKKTTSFTYLGSKLTSHKFLEEEINNSIAKFTKNLCALYPLLKKYT